MNLIKTHDGLMAWNLNGKVIWCETHEMLISIGWAHIAPRKDAAEKVTFELDVEAALNRMTRTGDTIAEFGVFGTFMYTSQEVEYEF